MADLSWQALLLAAIPWLLLVMVANGAPVVASQVLASHGAWPIDGGLRLKDGRPLFGYTKTWRGLLASVLITAALVWVVQGVAIINLNITVMNAGLFAGAAMCGDLLSSFIKRRTGVPPSGRMLVVDQLFEALLPMLLMVSLADLDIMLVVVVVLLFVTLGPPLSWCLHRLHLRKQPY